MCLSIEVADQKQAKELAENPNVATKNIVVYKRLRRNGKSPYRFFSYERGFHYYQTSKKKLTGKFVPNIWNNKFRVDSGLHAHKTKEIARKVKGFGEVVVRMIIPKGALYYENNLNIVSSELIFPYSDEEIEIYLAENKQNKMEQLNKKLQAQFDKMCATGKLFRSSISGHQLWDLYLGSFKKEDDPVFRDPNSTEHNCNLCNNFIRRYGNIVAINEDLTISSIFDVDLSEDDEYYLPVQALARTLRNSPVKDVFFETFKDLNFLPYESCTKKNEIFKLGIASNVKRYTKEEAEMYGVVKPNEIRTFHHFSLLLPKAFVDMTDSSIETIMGEHRDKFAVFLRGLEEISLDTLELVRDLISQGSLLDGTTHLYKVEEFIKFKEAFNKLPEDKRANYAWVASRNLNIAKFRNELIGVLCTELTQGEDLNQACQNWNKRVDPINYMKAVAPFTEKQKKDAAKFLKENGYEESFNRRFATLADIKTSEIKHISAEDSKIKEVSILDGLKSTPTQHKRSEFDKVEEVSIEKFMKDILPKCTSVEAFLENKHEGNMVSLTTSNVEDSKPIFKWSNNYSWTYNGDLAGKSQIKEAVKTAGGRVDGVLRFSMIWNDGNGTDHSDLDAWCTQPNGEQIGFSTPFRKDRGYGAGAFSSCSGQLDLDNTNPGNKMGIENIYFTDAKKMLNGKYVFVVNQYSARNSKGFKAEIEFNGEIHTYTYDKPVSGAKKVATVTFKNGEFSIEHHLPSEESSKEIYDLSTGKFHKVNLVCLSPNHWGKNKVGNKHFFFMLDGCKAPGSIRAFHNENLNDELLKFRKVMEPLGSLLRIESTPKQLSGLGFNATVKDELIVRLGGSFKRVIKIKF